MYNAIFDEEWPDYFNKLDNQIKERIAKKIKKILEHPQKRHLTGNAKYFVDEVGQHRIVYRVFESSNEAKMSQLFHSYCNCMRNFSASI